MLQSWWETYFHWFLLKSASASPSGTRGLTGGDQNPQATTKAILQLHSCLGKLYFEATCKINLIPKSVT